MKFTKTYSDVKENEVLVREGSPTIAREKVGKKMRDVSDAERQLQKEIAERSAKLADAREAAVELEDAFASAISERNQTRKNIAVYTSTVQTGIARMQELRRWLETNFQDGHTCEQDAEFVRHQHLVEWLPLIVEKSKSRLADLDKQITELAKQNDLPIPE